MEKFVLKCLKKRSLPLVPRRLLPHQTFPGLAATCFPSTATSTEYERVTSRGRLSCLHRAGGTTECSERNSWRSWRPWWQSPEFAWSSREGFSKQAPLCGSDSVSTPQLNERNKLPPWAKHGWSTVRAHPNKRFLVEVVDDVHHILSSGRGLERFAEEEIFVNFHLEHPKSPLGEISPRLGTAVFVWRVDYSHSALSNMRVLMSGVYQYGTLFHSDNTITDLKRVFLSITKAYYGIKTV